MALYSLGQSTAPKQLNTTGTAAALTGTTNETVLATITIPAGAIGANGHVEVTALFSCTNTANVKTARVRLGGIAGTILYAPAITSTAGIFFERHFYNRNSASSQIVSYGTASANSFTTSTTAFPTATVDTTAAVDLVLTGQLASGTDTMTLEAYSVEIFYKA